MTLKADQQQVKALLTETITLLCKNGLHFKSEFCVEGLIGVTLDHDEVFLINIKETVRSDPLAGPSLADDPDAGEPKDQEKLNDFQEMPDPPGLSKPEENNKPPGADGSSAPSMGDGHNMVRSVAPPPPVQKYQRSRSTVPFHTFEDLLPQSNGDLRSNDDYDLSLLAHSACVYGQQEGKLSMKLQNAAEAAGGRRSCSGSEFSGVFAENFSRHIESERRMSGAGQAPEGVVASIGALQKEGLMTMMERPAKRQRLESAEMSVGGLECGLLDAIAGGCADGIGLSAEHKISDEIVNIKEEPSLDGLSLAYSAMQAGHFDLESNQTFPFTSSQHHMTGSHSASALVPGCSILDGSGLDLQSQATRLAMLHLQLPTRRYSIAGKMFHCLACGKALSSLHNLKLHEATVHRGLFQYRCPLCGKGLRQERDLRGHLANRHNMKKDFRCSICGNEFGYKRNLKQHMVSYHGWKDAVVQLPLRGTTDDLL